MVIYTGSKHLTLWEQETIFNFNEDEKHASVYTYQPSLIKRLDGFCKKFPDTFKCVKEDWYGKHLSKTYEFPKKHILITSPKVRSEKQIEHAKKMGLLLAENRRNAN